RDRVRTEEHPAEADQVERDHALEEDGTGAVVQLGEPSRHAMLPAEATHGQAHAVIGAPEDERPGGPVPEASQHHRDHEVAVRLPSGAARAAERYVQVVA